MELNHLVPAIYQQIVGAPLVGAHDPRQGGHEGRPHRDGIGRECPDI